MTINLTPAAMAVRGATDDTVALSVDIIARRAGISVATTRKHLRTLEALGEVTSTLTLGRTYYRRLAQAEQDERAAVQARLDEAREVLTKYCLSADYVGLQAGEPVIHLSLDAFEALLQAEYARGSRAGWDVAADEQALLADRAL